MQHWQLFATCRIIFRTIIVRRRPKAVAVTVRGPSFGNKEEFALRCVSRCLAGAKLGGKSDAKSTGTDSESLRPWLRGIAVAPCCHHRCTWRDFVGRDWFVSRGIGKVGFNAICRWSSWGTLGSEHRRDAKARVGDEPAAKRAWVAGEQGIDEKKKEERPVGLTPLQQFSAGHAYTEKVRLGTACIRVLDTARQSYLESLGMKTRIVRYASREISPENRLLVATCACDEAE